LKDPFSGIQKTDLTIEKQVPGVQKTKLCFEKSSWVFK
jgi:hypothetical protein